MELLAPRIIVFAAIAVISLAAFLLVYFKTKSSKSFILLCVCAVALICFVYSILPHGAELMLDADKVDFNIESIDKAADLMNAACELEDDEIAEYLKKGKLSNLTLNRFKMSFSNGKFKQLKTDIIVPLDDSLARKTINIQGNGSLSKGTEQIGIKGSLSPGVLREMLRALSDSEIIREFTDGNATLNGMETISIKADTPVENTYVLSEGKLVKFEAQEGCYYSFELVGRESRYQIIIPNPQRLYI